jgi:hypothetical protein
MILAVHISSDCAANRHESGARHHGREKASRHECGNYVAERYPTFASKETGPLIESDHPVEPGQINYAAGSVYGGIPVGAAGAAWNKLVRIGRNNLG